MPLINDELSIDLVSRQLNLLQSILGAIYISENLGDALQECLNVICHDMKWQVGHVYMVSEKETEMQLIPTEYWYFEKGSEDIYAEFVDITRSTILKDDEGMIGKVFSSGKHLWVDDVSTEKGFVRNKLAKNIGVKAGFAFPIKTGAGIIAVMEFFFKDAMTKNDCIISVIDSIGVSIGSLLSRKKMDDELRNNQKMLKAITDNIVDAIVMSDNRGDIVAFKGAAEKIFGYKENEIIGKNVKVLMPEIYAKRHDNYLDNYNLGEPVRLLGLEKELVSIRKTGEKFPIDIALARSDIEGEDLFIAIIRDITERKEEQLEVEQFKQTLDKTLDCVFMFDPDSMFFTYANQGALNQIGYDYQEILKMKPFDLKPEYSEEEFSDLAKKLIYGDSPSVSFETIHESKCGELIPVEIFLQYISYNEGGSNFVAIVRDISDRKISEYRIKEALKDARSANNAKSDFLARMSHEIRTPMNGILGTAGLLIETDLDKKQSLYAKTIERSGENLLVIVNEILDYSKIEAGKLTLNIAPFNIYDDLNDIKQLYGSIISEKGIVLELDCPDDLPEYLMGDSVRFRQILLNLISNAIKFTENGKVSINVERQELIDNRVKIKFSVVDTGCGVSKRMQDNIFEPFSQADMSTVRAAGGTGLGLPICKSLVGMMGGNIGLNSKEDIGSEFFFCLYFDISTVNEFIKSRDAVCDYSGAKFNSNILVVDDVETNRFITSELLYSMGCNVDLVNDGKCAVDKVCFEKNEYDLILMDLHMPVMDGMTAMKKIKENKIDVPVIALTANVLQSEKEKCLEEGFDGFLGKPVSKKDIASEFIRFGMKNIGNVDKKGLIDQSDISDAIVTFEREFVKQYNAAAIKVIDLMIKDSDDFIKKITASVESKDIEDIKISAHSMKSISASVGGKKLSYLSKKMEDMADNEDIKSIEEFLSEYVKEYRKLKVELLRYEVD